MAIQDFDIIVASAVHADYAPRNLRRNGGIGKSTWYRHSAAFPEYVANKMLEGKAVIAFNKNGTWAGFCYIETWSNGTVVANSGLIVSPKFRKEGLAKAIKERIFELSRSKYPEAKIFGLTTGLAVMKINSDLGYEPVTYSELTQDEAFWAGCKSCVNYDILMSKNRKNCLCTAMLFDPAEKHPEREDKVKKIMHKATLLERILHFHI